MNETGRIVVGIDGSPCSQDALRWALDEARRRDCRVEAVHVWHYPTLTYMPGIAPTPVFAEADMEAEARAVLDEAVDKVLAGTTIDVPVDRTVASGGAVAGLVARSHGAELLVVGHRGHGGFRGLLLGSVAHQCASHAACPVVIVRPPTPA